ncbi:lisH domain-containing protein C1711.05 isoform X2 [Siniperca chuatsi]|uniref:lisH domain-containing protein C1711.05 isoform X2 n=1 Tax=Siniperca chuatsi TaxID=119488 RepID=UPI001CE1B8AE|nr:lisH domain-containing protein C1711.05 isoform X2 [Siniperca chuatsi]
MRHGHKVSCVLCQRSEETKLTGALSTKDEVTAHQNCLLFSSGIYCRNSPEFDDLFGFSVEDVMTEVKRGSKLICKKCQKKGATAGCEVKRCQKSYHYPCAVQDGAEIVEDEDKGNYGLYCFKHHQQLQNNGSVNGRVSSFTKPGTSGIPNEAGSSERNTTGDSTAGGPPVYSSDSNSSSSATRLSKRPLSFNDKQEETPSKRKSESWKKKISDNSSNSDENEPIDEMAVFAPLEMDLDDSANSDPESQVSLIFHYSSVTSSVMFNNLNFSSLSLFPLPPPSTVRQLIRKDTDSPTASTSGNQLEDESRDGNKDNDETIIDSDAESESLLLPVEICLSQSLSATSATDSTLTVSTADPRVESVEVVQRKDPEPSIDSTSFWKSCNAARCTQAIFTDFITEMNGISSRIQSDQASQEDYDCALTVMLASGKLAELVTKQQKELQRKQTELRKAAAAMKDVVSALR